jgi:hypothetical protein
MRRIAVLIMCLGAGSLSACSFPPGKCVGTGQPGLILYVLDSVTSLPPAVPVSLIIASPAYTDTLPHPGDASFDGKRFVTLYDMVGTYALTVRATGYEPWTSTVVIERDRCSSPIRVDMVAKLRPLP